MTRERFTIDSAHSSIDFTVRHLVISKVRGGFDRFSGTLEIDADDLTRSSVDVVIEAASVNTREEKRDAHLRSADFFDVEAHPEIRFRSKRIERKGGDHLRVVGDLSIHGITREVALEVEDLGRVADPWGGARGAFSARTKIDRHDFNMRWNAALEAGGFVVGHEIQINLEVEVIKVAAQQAA